MVMFFFRGFTNCFNKKRNRMICVSALKSSERNGGVFCFFPVCLHLSLQITGYFWAGFDSILSLENFWEFWARSRPKRWDLAIIYTRKSVKPCFASTLVSPDRVFHVDKATTKPWSDIVKQWLDTDPKTGFATSQVFAGKFGRFRNDALA